MRKIILYTFMAMTLVISLIGCGAKSEEPAEKTESFAAEETEKESVSSEASEAADESEEDKAQTAEGTTIDTNLFSVVYSDDWACDTEGDVSDFDRGSRAAVSIPDPDSGWDKVRVNIAVTQDDAASFSDRLHNWGMNAEDAVTGNNDYDVRNINGVDCWVAKGGGSTLYLGYMPDVNAFINISVDGDDQWELVDPLIDSIKLHVPAWDEEVTPWYWEGTPYTVSEHNTTVGSFTVSSKQIPLDVVNPCFEIFDARVQVVGNDYYILDNYLLKKYVREGDLLKYDSDIELPFEPEDIGVGADGTIYISDFGQNFTKIQDGTEITVSTETDHVILDPACTWGVSYFSSPEVLKINVADGSFTEHTVPGLSTISHMAITNNYIVISGSRDDEERKACLKIFDKDFNELMMLDGTTTTTGYYGSVSAAAETANGLMVFDGNMRDVYFIDKNMSLIAAIDMTDLMGTSYPWPCQAVTLEDGSVIAICTDDRADKSCDEAVIFQLTGF